MNCRICVAIALFVSSVTATCNIDFPAQECGGACGFPCPVGFFCKAEEDCAFGPCVGGTCQDPITEVPTYTTFTTSTMDPPAPTPSPRPTTTTSPLPGPTRPPVTGSKKLGEACSSTSECPSSTECFYNVCQEYWEQKPFDSASNLFPNWNVVKMAYGASNSDLASDPAGSKEKTLSIFYPKGSMNPGNRPQGGFGFYSIPFDLNSFNTMMLEYEVFFPKGFDFVLGGKLPGLYGGRPSCSGGDSALDCFSTRFMWRAGGAGEVYLYVDKDAQISNICSIVPNSICNSVYGWSIGRGAFSFNTGAWTKVRQFVKLNSFNGNKPVANGVVTVWIDNETKPSIHLDKIVYRTSSNVKTVGIDFETFFGGSQPQFRNTKDQYTYFKGFKLSAYNS